LKNAIKQIISNIRSHANEEIVICASSTSELIDKFQKHQNNKLEQIATEAQLLQPFAEHFEFIIDECDECVFMQHKDHEEFTICVADKNYIFKVGEAHYDLPISDETIKDVDATLVKVTKMMEQEHTYIKLITELNDLVGDANLKNLKDSMDNIDQMSDIIKSIKHLAKTAHL